MYQVGVEAMKLDEITQGESSKRREVREKTFG